MLIIWQALLTTSPKKISRQILLVCHAGIKTFPELLNSFFRPHHFVEEWLVLRTLAYYHSLHIILQTWHSQIPSHGHYKFSWCNSPIHSKFSLREPWLAQRHLTSLRVRWPMKSWEVIHNSHNVSLSLELLSPLTWPTHNLLYLTQFR